MNEIKRTIKYLLNILKIYKLRKKQIYIDPSCSFNRSSFNTFVKIYENTSFNDSYIDSYSYVHKNCILNNIKVGKFCSIAPNTEIVYGSHPLDYISTHPIFYSTRKQVGTSFTEKQLYEEFNFVEGTKKSSIIGNDVWIGYGVKIIEGVKIADGAIVLSGAVVTKDVEPYSIVGGVPAKHIKFRFSEEEKEQLLKFKWWDKDINWLKENHKIFLNKSEFFEKVKEG